MKSFRVLPHHQAQPAYAGIPLTARNYATSVRFLTYYKSDIVSDEYWKELARTNDTLGFLHVVRNFTKRSCKVNSK